MQPLTISDLTADESGMIMIARIGGATYYEMTIVVKNDAGRTAIVGLARDWPILQREATIADLERRLFAAERHAAELQQQLLIHAEACIPSAVARAATGAEPPDWTRHAEHPRAAD